MAKSTKTTKQAASKTITAAKSGKPQKVAAGAPQTKGAVKGKGQRGR